MNIRETTTDAELLAAWTDARNPEALSVLAHRYAPMVLGVCRRHAKTAADADDAFQVTFMILARSAGSIRSPAALPGWLHGTAYRVSARTRVRPPTSDEVPIDEIPDPREPLDQLARRHQLQMLDEELARMPETLRAALVMHYLDGLRLGQVAERLGTTLGAIRGRVQRGRRELRQRLILRGVSLSAAIAALETLPDHSAAAAELADAFVASATADAAGPSATPHDAAALQTLLSSSSHSSSASLIMKSSLLVVASLIAMVLSAGHGGGQPSSGTGSVVRLAGAGATSPTVAALTMPATLLAAASQAPAASERTAPSATQSQPSAQDPSGGEAGKASAPTGGNQTRQTAATEVSAFTARLQNMMQEEVDGISMGTMPIRGFVDSLGKQLRAPVFFQPTPELAEVLEDASISFDTSGLPLGVELTKALRPHGLRAIVRDDAIVITADTVELARRGVGTSRYINIDDAYMRELEAKLDQTYSANLNRIPLEDAVRQISLEKEIFLQIDTRALEDLGLTRDVPVSANLQDINLYAFLQRMLMDSDLTIRPMDGYVMITTVEDAEDPANLISRVYWLDATGLSADAAAEAIQTLINPDTWESLGGPSTITALSANEHGRTTLLIAAPYAVHREIKKLLNAVREGVVDPSAEYKAPPSPMPKGGFMGGGMGGMGGGMGGMGGGMGGMF